MQEGMYSRTEMILFFYSLLFGTNHLLRFLHSKVNSPSLFLMRSSSLGEDLYKPSFAGFVDVDLADKKLSLRSLVCKAHYQLSLIYALNYCSSYHCFSLPQTVFLSVVIYMCLWVQIDHSVVESFGAGGKTCITSRVYPTLAVLGNAHLYLFNNGSETVTVDNLSAWSMNRPLMN